MSAPSGPATAVQTKQDIFERIQRHRAELRRYGVKRLGLFGSFVRDEQVPDSDVDLLVEFEPGMKTFNNYMDIAFFLEEQLRRKVDVLTVESLSRRPRLQHNTLKDAQFITLG